MAPVAIEIFAAPPRLTAADRQTAVVLDRSQPQLPPRPVLTAPELFTLQYCRFATATRLICSLRGPGTYQGVAIPTSRRIAVDVDGSNQKVIAPIEPPAPQ